MTVDNHVGSPFRDRIYVTWTTFAADGTAYIYEAHSSDYGETFSAPVLVSSDSALCGNTYGLPTPQRALQREPVLRSRSPAPDGALYVVVGELQQRGHRQGQPQPDAAGEVDRRRRRPSARRSRSATTTTCPTAPPTRVTARTPAGRACPRRAPTQLDLPGHELPVGRGEPDERQPGRRDLRLVHQPQLQRVERLHARPASRRLRHQHLHRGEDAGRLQQRHPDQRVDQRRHARSPATTDRPAHADHGHDGRRTGTTDQFWQWAAFTNDGQAGRDLLRPPVRRRTSSTGRRTSACPGRKRPRSFDATRVPPVSMPAPTQF